MVKCRHRRKSDGRPGLREEREEVTFNGYRVPVGGNDGKFWNRCGDGLVPLH